MKKGGFTLVELIAVVIILGILAAIGVPQYRRAMERARGAAAYAALGQIAQAQKIKYTEDQKYLVTALPMTANEQKALDISMLQDAQDGGWNYGVTSNDVNAVFIAKAARTKGPCASNATGNTITVDQLGVLNDAWKACVANF